MAWVGLSEWDGGLTNKCWWILPALTYCDSTPLVN